MSERPPSSERVARKRQQRKEAILNAAFAAIAEAGPAEFSLNQLARDLDYTPGALYWYYPSKDALVAAVQRMALEELAERLKGVHLRWQEQIEARAIPERFRALTTLLLLARTYLELPATAPQHARVIAFSLDPRVWLGAEEAKTLGPVMMDLFAPVERAFAEAASAGVLCPGSSWKRTMQFWAALQGVSQTSKLERIAPDLFPGGVVALGIDIASVLFVGWGTPPGDIEQALQFLRNEAGASPR